MLAKFSSFPEFVGDESCPGLKCHVSACHPATLTDNITEGQRSWSPQISLHCRRDQSRRINGIYRLLLYGVSRVWPWTRPPWETGGKGRTHRQRGTWRHSSLSPSASTPWNRFTTRAPQAGALCVGRGGGHCEAGTAHPGAMMSMSFISRSAFLLFPVTWWLR